jgi:hypothetical protein
MRLPKQRHQPEEPERLSQRWVVILVAALVGGLTIGGLTRSAVAGVPTALAIVALLHTIMR